MVGRMCSCIFGVVKFSRQAGWGQKSRIPTARGRRVKRKPTVDAGTDAAMASIASARSRIKIGVEEKDHPPGERVEGQEGGEQGEEKMKSRKSPKRGSRRVRAINPIKNKRARADRECRRPSRSMKGAWRRKPASARRKDHGAGTHHARNRGRIDARQAGAG